MNNDKLVEYLIEEVREIRKSQESLMEMVYANNTMISNLKIKLNFIYSAAGLVAGIVGAVIGDKLGLK